MAIEPVSHRRYLFFKRAVVAQQADGEVRLQFRHRTFRLFLDGKAAIAIIVDFQGEGYAWSVISSAVSIALLRNFILGFLVSKRVESGYF